MSQESEEVARIFWDLFRPPSQTLPATPTSTQSSLGTPPGGKPK